MARSPAAATPLPKSSVPQSPALDPAGEPPSQQPVPFPPPQTFDILPQLHGLLVRLLAPPSTAGGPSGSAREDATGAVPPSGPATGPAQSQNQHQHQRQQQSLVTDNENNTNNGAPQTLPSSAAPGPASVTAEIAALGPNAPPPLDAKDLPTEANSIKIRAQKAQAVVDSLPDVHRSVEEQELEIGELEGRIAKLKSAVSEFGRRAGT